ncbi:hypothetical protein GYB22_06060 [bacterium]|nr:hypothetical protein [bacterium]
MPGLRDRQFNLIHFLYGFGAIVILVAALSTVLEWKYARHLFAAGIIVEIVIFIVSLIDIPPSEIPSTPEIVFPPQDHSTEDSEAQKKTSPEKNNELDKVLSSIEGLNDSFQLLRRSNQDLNESVQQIKQDYREIKRSTLNFEQSLNTIKSKVDQTSEKVEKLEKEGKNAI